MGGERGEGRGVNNVDDRFLRNLPECAAVICILVAASSRAIAVSRKPFHALLLLLVWAIVTLTMPQPAWATIAQPDRVPLTLELLQERLKNPMQTDGVRILDLSRLTIDLRSENAALRDQFYSLVQAQLQRPGTPVGLDLSYSQIQGEFKISQLGLRAPLYGQSLSPIFTPAEQQQLQRDRRLLSRLSTLSQSLLSTPDAGIQPAPLQITVFRGPLKLIQTRFNGRSRFYQYLFP